MDPFPHRYAAAARAAPDGDVTLESAAVAPLRSASPREFGGPGDRWSPETLLLAAVGDCFVLTFRAIAAASTLPWIAVSCEVEGTLDRIDRVTRFTAITLRATLEVPAGVNEETARRALEKAEHSCLITNSLKADTRLETAIHVTHPAPA